jgi:hypothetical protein
MTFGMPHAPISTLEDAEYTCKLLEHANLISPLAMAWTRPSYTTFFRGAAMAGG